MVDSSRSVHGTHPNLEGDDLVRWLMAGVLAAAAFVGSLSLIVAAYLFFSLPSWIEVPVAVLLTGGASLYAWTLATVLRRKE